MTDIAKKLDHYLNEAQRLEAACIILRGQVLHYKYKLQSPSDALGALLCGDGKALKKSALERLGLWDLDAFRAQITEEDFIQ
jgi:hypothetical protein